MVGPANRASEKASWLMFSFGDLAAWGGGFGAALACRPGWLRKAIRAAAQQGLRAALRVLGCPWHWHTQSCCRLGCG